MTGVPTSFLPFAYCSVTIKELCRQTALIICTGFTFSSACTINHNHTLCANGKKQVYNLNTRSLLELDGWSIDKEVLTIDFNSVRLSLRLKVARGVHSSSLDPLHANVSGRCWIFMREADPQMCREWFTVIFIRYPQESVILEDEIVLEELRVIQECLAVFF